MSQWDKLRKVINGVRTGHVMTDEAILEISYILDIVIETRTPFELIKTANSDIAPTGGSSDEEVRTVSKFPTRREMVEAYNADALADEWQRYANNRKTAFADQLLSMEDFRLYITYWYGTDIAPTGDSRDRSGVSDEEANRRASAFQARLSRGDKLRMARIVPEAVKQAIADEEVWERQDRLRVESSTDRMTSDEEAKLDRPDEEFEMNESGGYPVLGLGLLQFGRPETKLTGLTLHDVMDELHNYDELRLQAKRVFADLMAQTWEHFVTRGCGLLSGRRPTADYFRQYVLDWFNLDIRA